MREFNIWPFIGGVAVFIFAMNQVESSLKNLAGRPFKKILEKSSGSPLKMVLGSIAASAVLQSSSAVMLMVISFVGARIMKLRGALAAMLGANLGTTITGWIIALVGFKINFHSFSYVLLSVALIGLIPANKKSKLYYLTEFLVGFAFLFISLEWLKGSLNESVADYLHVVAGKNYLLFIPIGFLFTAIVQSSSLTVAVALSSIHNHLIPFESAAALVTGSELGTSLKFLLTSVRGIADKKRVAWGNFMLNAFTLIFAAAFLYPLVYMIKNILGVTDELSALVVFQTAINLISLLLFFPMLGFIAKRLERLISESKNRKITRFIGTEEKENLAAMMNSTDKEINRYFFKSLELNKNFLGITVKKTNLISQLKNVTKPVGFSKEYEELKMIEGAILEYITDYPQQEFSEEELQKSSQQIDIVRRILRSSKNLKDIHHNLIDLKSSSNDTLYSAYREIRKNIGSFYDRLEELMDSGNKISAKELDDLIHSNRKWYHDVIAGCLAALKEDKISEIDSSNLINVYREIYSANKALVRAMANQKNLSPEKVEG
jgi:phosphate:Na+ symporter